MPVSHMILIALAGVGAGAINAIVGSGTLITFPTLVALGYPPVTATMSNAVGLVAGGVSGTWGYRRELRGQSAEHVSGRRMAALVFGTFVIGIYGGYFTAAQGIMLIAAMSALLPEDMQRMNAAKNLLSLLVNIVAAVAYTVVAFDRISWEAAGLIAVGSLIGGFLGAHYGRRLSPNALRAAIVMVGAIGLYRLVTI